MLGDRDEFLGDWGNALAETAEKDPRVDGPEDPRKRAGRKPKGGGKGETSTAVERRFDVDKDKIRTALARIDAGLCDFAGIERRFDTDEELDPQDFLDLMSEAFVPLAEKYGDRLDKSPEMLAFGAILLYAGSLAKDWPTQTAEEDSGEKDSGPIETERKAEF